MTKAIINQSAAKPTRARPMTWHACADFCMTPVVKARA
eukprot:CAMPEP_0178395894 /NCGR_PEP_ID=MMETSP0689_2-20121128/13451_1 /TAXON_ID=160604 /ORGANISM="Amphidinium massartii, Strain CS-259" /LENGTH=37 /DNA_ID= /DNA_START= /DNA_END= /DNA_ORIENTATION=